MKSSIFVGLDVHKKTVSIAIAEGQRGGEVRHVGTFENRVDVLRKMIERLARGGRHLNFCYEAGPCGYGLYRWLRELGHDCTVVAPSLIPRKPGDRVKTDRRDSLTLAKLHRSGELTAVWVPDGAHEAMRDLVRARATAVRVLAKARQHLGGFLLRHGKVYAGQTTWTRAYRRWLTTVRFDHPAQQIVLQDYIHAVEDAEKRVGSLVQQIEKLLEAWSMAPLVQDPGDARNCFDQCRYAGGRNRRLHTLRQPASAHGLCRSGSIRAFKRCHVRRGGVTKAGNAQARRALIEGVSRSTLFDGTVVRLFEGCTTGSASQAL
jgi:transposase